LKKAGKADSFELKPSMPKLIVYNEDGSSVTHELTEETTSIGRLSDNVIQIADASVSSHHAELVLNGESYLLRDLGSTNGTRVNDVQFTEGPVKEGDHVRFGQIECRYVSEHPSDAHPIPRQEAVAAHVAETSFRPGDFSNASPFKGKMKKKDPVATGIMAFAVVAVLGFAAAMVMILQLTPPQL
jgi:predicted component of type VI protein secretion system